MKNFLILLALLLTQSLFGQFVLVLKVKNFPKDGQRKVFFECFEKEKWVPVNMNNEKLELSEESKLTVTFNPKHNGQYRLRFMGSGKPWTDFWIDLKELPKNVLLDIDYTELMGLPSSLYSSETQYYYKNMGAQYARVQWTYDSLKSIANQDFIQAQNMCNLAFSETQSKWKSIPTCTQIFYPIFSHPSVNSLKTSQDTIQFFNLFLNNLNFSQTEILYHYALVRSLNQYINDLRVSKKSDALPYFIDQVIGRLENNAEVNQYIHAFILDKILDAKDENTLNYYLTNYIDGCASQENQTVNSQNLIDALKACTPGKKAAELKYPNEQNQKISLESTCKKNKITLVLFWRSNCSHCEEFHPVLKSIYEKYHAQGLEVYAISIDKNIEDWKKHLLAKPAPWINVYAPLQERNSLVKLYPSPSTPTIIALDSKGKVISRLIVRSKLENFLEENKAYFK